MNLNLQVKPRGDASVVASYSCPCGCNPRLSYDRGQAQATDSCCCGNQFAVGAAAAGLQPVSGFVKEVQAFDAPWGERVEAAWTIGPSTDPNAAPEDSHGHGHGQESAPPVAPAGSAIDPVCGMTVKPEAARSKGLFTQYAGVQHVFCGQGCKVAFDADPSRYLESSRSSST